ncbi:MAG: excinuclease ABC subunit UvrC [candidate division Zixibacteria bacterium]|nr:excinuclease ABC subunit UvrC [candidate division Zixibacteria bacterium]
MPKTESPLQKKLQTLPDSPGVYMFKDSSGKYIYIGKAKVLKNRVRSYFGAKKLADPKSARIVARTTDIELLVTDTEVEALILEANLVRQHKPRYNVDLKDDKHFPYIKITTYEPFPRILVVRRIEKDSARYFGPFTSAKGMRKTIEFLRRLFKIRTCNLVIPPPKGRQYKVCLDYHIKRCKGPCEALQTVEDYKENIHAVLMILSGKSKKVIEKLQVKMEEASEQMEYEEAGLLRDQIEAIESVMVKQKVDVGSSVDRDIIALAREGRLAVAAVLQLREGILIGRQDFQLTAEADETDEAIVDTFLTQYYSHQPNLPKEIYLPIKVENLKLINDWLNQQRGSKINIVIPQKGEKVRLVELAAQNARLLLDDLLIQKKQQSERTSKMVTSLKKELSLSESPRRIACFDISNTGETDAVGSCVYFENGRPKKKEYRHFKIKGVKGQDDYRMMREVVGRYFYRIKDEKKTPPDLLVIDGGKGQLSSVIKELGSLGFDKQPVVSLAKRLEEVFVPGASDSITISRSSPALMLLKQLRDEAHRFAVSYNRKVRSKRTIKSELDKIPGVGPSKKHALLKQFGSVKRIKAATPEQIAELTGINIKLANAILSYLNGG